MAMRVCKDCGKEYSNSARRCPNCGAQNPIMTGLQIAIILASGFFCLMLYFTCRDITSGTSKQKYTTSPVQPTFVLDTRPDSQKRFEEICITYASQYARGQNELQKSTTRTERRKALQQLGIRSVTNWVGTLDSLKTNNDGKAIVSIKLNDRVKVETWNNAFSDMTYNTLIPMESSLYKKLYTMKAGDEVKVRFSGNLFVNNTDYNLVKNITESGVMSNPEFLIRFSDVTVLKNEPFATEDINLREGPSAEHNIIEGLKGGTSVKLLGYPESNGWVKARVNGKEGYVNSKYLIY